MGAARARPPLALDSLPRRRDNPANPHRTVSLIAKEFHYAFGNMLTEEESDALHDAWTIPGAGRPLFQGASANFFPHFPARVDIHLAGRRLLLLTSGTDDHVVPLKVTQEVFDKYQHGSSDTQFSCSFGTSRSSPLPRKDARIQTDFVGRPYIVPNQLEITMMDDSCQGFTADIACAAVDNAVGHFTPLSGRRDGPQSWGFRPGAGAASQLPASAGCAVRQPVLGARGRPTGRR
jgi:hypothetical protein